MYGLARRSARFGGKTTKLMREKSHYYLQQYPLTLDFCDIKFIKRLMHGSTVETEFDNLIKIVLNRWEQTNS